MGTTSIPPVALAALVGARSRPVAPASERVIEVPEAMVGLFPDRGLRRGSTVTVGTTSDGGGVSGGMALALAVLSAASGTGLWCAAIGVPEVGLVAAAQLGVRLDRLALVPRPEGQWVVVAAALLDGVDLLLARPPMRMKAGDARRLVARTREREAVLVVVGHDRWPEAADIRLTVVTSRWSGIAHGHGYLRSRQLQVAATGRRAAARERRCHLLLPGPDGALAALPAVTPARVAGVPVAGVPVAGVPVGGVPVGGVQVGGVQVGGVQVGGVQVGGVQVGGVQVAEGMAAG